MKNNVIALEISHRYIKVAFGTTEKDQVLINYVKKVPINHFLENGVIKEKGKYLDLINQNGYFTKLYKFLK